VSSRADIRILITGGAGFIGSHHVDACLAAGYEVAVLDNLSTGNRSNLQGKDVEIFEVDLLDKTSLARVFSEFKPTHISHHAAQVSVRRSLENPYADAEINILGLLNLLQLAQEAKIEQFIFASSGGAIYGENEAHVPSPENAPTQPTSPYAIAKLASEYYINFFATKAGFKATILRYANVYGPRQDPMGEAGVICLFLDRFVAGSPTIIYGTGEQVRDFIYVEDVAAAHLAAIEKNESGIFNVGSGELTSVNQIHQTLSTIWRSQTGQTIAPATQKEPIPGEIFWSSLDVSKARNELAWQAKTSLEDGLNKTVTWFLGT
jgi:UDP-glucose 4-epimerase